MLAPIINNFHFIAANIISKNSAPFLIAPQRADVQLSESGKCASGSDTV